MKYSLKKLGKLSVPSIGLGSMGLTAMQDSALKTTKTYRIDFLHKAIELGVRHFDTAHIYNNDNGNNEEEIGSAISSQNRSEFIIATKTGIQVKNGKKNINNTPAFMRESCEQSLKNLNVDYLDIVQVNRIDIKNIEEGQYELSKMVSEGKIKHLGLSEASAKYIKKLNDIHPVSAVQMEYSIAIRDIEESIIPVCNELDIGISCYSPLARGVFNNNRNFIKLQQEQAKDFRKSVPQLNKENWDHNVEVVKQVQDIAGGLGVDTNQLALAWLITRRGNICAIPGTTKIENLESNMKSVQVAEKLTAEHLNVLDNLSLFKGMRQGKGFPTQKSTE